MGCTVREKHIRTNRRARSTRPDSNHAPPVPTTNGTGDSSAITTNGIKPTYHHMSLNHLSNNPNASNRKSDSNSVFDDSGWGYCTEEQLEEILLKNLEFLYNEAINKLVALGYDEDVALKAILKNGHCYGGMDVMTNILHNSLAYLNSDGANCGGNNGVDGEEAGPAFLDLRQLEEYSLAGMVSLLQQVKPHLSKGDAMWCLLMSDLHVGRASVMEIPVLPNGSSSPNATENALASGSGNPEGVSSNGGPVGVAPALCRFHSGWGFGNGGTSEFPMNGMNGFLSYASEMALQREIECPKRFNLSPSMKSLMKRNVAMFAAGFRANSKHFQSQSQPCASSLSVGDSLNGNTTTNTTSITTTTTNTSEVAVAQKEESYSYAKNQDVVNSMMTKFQDLNLGENAEKATLDQKDEMLLSLVHQIKDMEKQVKERREWAHEKAMQAARKLSNDLTELKTLRMERDETQRMKKGKQSLEDSTMKRLSEMENALRKASGQVDRANAAVRKLETENAEIRAEMEASKLSASESVTTCLEVAKREKKCLKRLLAWEKQKAKLQDDIAAEKRQIAVLQKETDELEAEAKAAEAKWRQEQKLREVLLTQLEEEKRLKESCESNNKRKIEAVRLKIDIDFQRHKDDLQRLEQEYARLKEDEHPDNIIVTENNSNSERETTIARLMQEIDELEGSREKDASCDRACMLCKKDEVSVVFLPCAHQVICASCNDTYGKKGCPYCRVPIEQRIRVFGATY